MLGITTRWECPSCGNTIKVSQPFWNKDLRKKMQEPKKCGCGRKGKFTLIGFEECQFEVIFEDKTTNRETPKEEDDNEEE